MSAVERNSSGRGAHQLPRAQEQIDRVCHALLLLFTRKRKQIRQFAATSFCRQCAVKVTISEGSE